MGNTGMESHMFDFFISEILNKTGENRPNLLDRTFCFSKMLSADVDAGFDPIYANVSDINNSAFLGRGVGLNKYTGARGKSGASDANAEYVAWCRNVLEKNDIKYQVSELGKVDVGGGGTIAYILANKGVDVIDCGVPVLSMHAPYEVTSKFDIYSAFSFYKAFWLE
jgi:aspartyl aminopeptidase